MTLCLCTCYSHCLECPSSLPCLGNSHSSLKTCLSLSPPPGSLSESSRGTCSIFSHFCFPPIPTSGRGLWFLGCTGERGSLTFHWVEIWVSRALGKFSSGCGPWWFLIKVFLAINKPYDLKVFLFCSPYKMILLSPQKTFLFPSVRLSGLTIAPLMPGVSHFL